MLNLSASSINNFVKCGVKYQLEKVLKVPEPGKKGYSLLHGEITGMACANAVKALVLKGGSPEDVIIKELMFAYETVYYKSGIEPELIKLVKRLISGGVDLDVIQEIDRLADTINYTKYEFKMPPVLKGGGVSKSKRTPSLSTMVLDSYEMVRWFIFQPDVQHFLCSLDNPVAEEKFTIKLADDVYSTGYFDLTFDTNHGPVVMEFKCTKTAYTPEVVNRLNQLVMYHIAKPDAKLFLVDLVHSNLLPVTITPETTNNYLNVARMMAKSIENDIFLPACGTDPYTEGTIMCGHKCVTCPATGGKLPAKEVPNND